MGRRVGEARTVLIFEHVTGGGLVGVDLPPSWATEGLAMLRAISGDFAAVPGVRVVTTLDARVSAGFSDGVEVHRVDGLGGEGWFESLVTRADYTLAIAPESSGLLASWVSRIEAVGGRSLGSSVQAIDWTGDKARLAELFFEASIPSPPTRLLGAWPVDWPGPVVVKPRWGAGSVDSVVVRDGQRPSWVPIDGTFLAQPYLPGSPMSASLLIGVDGSVVVLGVARQRSEVDDSGRISYRGGVISSKDEDCPSVVLRAVEVVQGVTRLPGGSCRTGDAFSDPLPPPWGRARVGGCPASLERAGPPRGQPVQGGGLQGFVGVDYLVGDRGEVTILEINPRSTTSYVGLTRLYPPGLVAGAWLESTDPTSDGWSERIRVARPPLGVVCFDADGTIHPDPGAAHR